MADSTQKKKEATEQIRSPNTEAEAREVERRLDILTDLWEKESAILQLEENLERRRKSIDEMVDEINKGYGKGREKARLSDLREILVEINAFIEDCEKIIRSIREKKKPLQKPRSTSGSGTKREIEKTVGQKKRKKKERGKRKEEKAAPAKPPSTPVEIEQPPSKEELTTLTLSSGEEVAPGQRVAYRDTADASSAAPPRPTPDVLQKRMKEIVAQDIRPIPDDPMRTVVGLAYGYTDMRGKKKMVKVRRKDAKGKRLFVYSPKDNSELIIHFADWPSAQKKKKREKGGKKEEEKVRVSKTKRDIPKDARLPQEPPPVPSAKKEAEPIALSSADIEEVVASSEPPPIPIETAGEEKKEKEADPELVQAVRTIEDAARDGRVFRLGGVAESIRIERAVPTPYRDDSLDSIRLSTGETMRYPESDELRRLAEAIREPAERTDRVLSVLRDTANWQETEKGEKEPRIAWPVELLSREMNISEGDAFKALMALARDGDIQELEFDEQTRPILVEVLGTTQRQKEKESVGTYDISPREVLGMLGSESVNRVLERIRDIFANENGTFDEMKAVMDTLFDELPEKQQRVLEQKLAASGKTFNDFLYEWKTGFSERVTKGLQYHMLASLERDAYAEEHLGTFEEETRAGIGKKGSWVERWKRNVKPALKSGILAAVAGTAVASGGAVVIGAVAGMVGTGAFRFFQRKTKDVKEGVRAAEAKLEKKRKEAIAHAQDRLRERLQKDGETIFANYFSILLKESGETNESAVREDVLNALRKETKETDATMAYLLAALRKRNPLLENSAFSEKAAKMGAWQTGTNEFLNAIKTGQLADLWKYDENRFKRLAGDIANAAVAGLTGGAIGIAAGSMAIKAGTRGGFGFAKGFVRTLLRGKKEAREGALEEEQRFAEQTLSEANARLRELFEKKTATPDDLEDLLRKNRLLHTLLANEDLLRRAPDLKPRIESAIDEVNTTGALVNILDALRADARDVQASFDAAMQARMQAFEKEKTPSRRNAIVQGLTEGSIVATIGAAVDAVRGFDIAKDINAWVRNLFSSDKSGAAAVALPYDRPVRPGVEPALEQADAAAKTMDESVLPAAQKPPSAAPEAFASVASAPIEAGPRQVGETKTFGELGTSSLYGAEQAMWREHGNDDMFRAIAARHPEWNPKFDANGNVTNESRILRKWRIEQAKENKQWFDKNAQYFGRRVFKSTEVSLVVDKDGYPTIQLEKYKELESEKIIPRRPRASSESESISTPENIPPETPMSEADKARAREARIFEEARQRFETSKAAFAEDVEEHKGALERSVTLRAERLADHPDTQGNIYTRGISTVLGQEEGDALLRDFSREYVSTHPNFRSTDPKDVEQFQDAWRQKARDAIVEYEREQGATSTRGKETLEAPTGKDKERVLVSRAKHIILNHPDKQSKLYMKVAVESLGQEKSDALLQEFSREYIKAHPDFDPANPKDNTKFQKAWRLKARDTIVEHQEKNAKERGAASESKEKQEEVPPPAKKPVVKKSSRVSEKKASPPPAPEAPAETPPTRAAGTATSETPIVLGKTERGRTQLSFWQPKEGKAVDISVPRDYAPEPKGKEITMTIGGEPYTGTLDFVAPRTGAEPKPVLVCDIGGGKTETIDLEKAVIIKSPSPKITKK